jgi:integrase
METYVTGHIVPYFEPLRLQLGELSPSHIQDYYNYKYSAGRRDGKEGGLAIESIIKHKSVLMTALDEAVVEGLIPTNPAKYVKLPAKRSSERKENFLTAEQAMQMLELFEETPFYSVVFTTLFYGLRKSEAIGLKWNSIDFKNNTLTLENVVVKNKSIEEKATMKTQASYHTYHLIPDVKRVLIKQRLWQNQNREKYGDAYIESDYVFTWEDGRPFRPDSLYRSFQRVLKRNGFSPLLRFHDLRHSTASILYSRGWDLKDIQMWLRHADIKTTGDVYTHIKQDFENDVPDYLKNIFTPTPKPKGIVLDTAINKK